MSSWESTGDSSATSVALTAHEVQAGDVLHSSFSSYSVLEFIGEGAFGKTAAAMNLRTKENVAIKILKNKESTQDTEHEVSMLRLIGDLDCDRNNMVKFHEQFVHMEPNCLVFERLHMSLYDLLKQGDWKYLPLHQIRPVAKQLLVTLDALKRIGVLHADIKPDNIMFVNLQDQPLRVKLIDFGCAMMTSQIELGMHIQPHGYRAPEISLGLPFTEAVDVWGVGCVLAFLYMTENLFSVGCEYQMVCIISPNGFLFIFHIHRECKWM
ncbi:homeodomain-interacting protein kinase 1-like [Paralichthys olivaceus]|uniref:homeodomain-interacting protein kinase 1-like n=1 Tax=Paralichthys olivaceus TaxID=8255 RepID=UPI003750C34B